MAIRQVGARRERDNYELKGGGRRGKIPYNPDKVQFLEALVKGSVPEPETMRIKMKWCYSVLSLPCQADSAWL